jgi:hypothetical protein
MTTDHEASRTLVKSPPELWAECSDAGSLARHLGEFGEIRITRLQPETIVAWEGERASGTVRIEPSGWGTKVTLTATAEAAELEEPAVAVAEEPEPVAVAEEPEPVAVVEEAPEPLADEPPGLPPALPAPRGGLWSRLFARRQTRAPIVVPEPPKAAAEQPEPVAVVEPEPTPEPLPPEPVAEKAEPAGPKPADVLVAALDSLGQAHHRPFSRS